MHSNNGNAGNKSYAPNTDGDEIWNLQNSRMLSPCFFLPRNAELFLGKAGKHHMLENKNNYIQSVRSDTRRCGGISGTPFARA